MPTLEIENRSRRARGDKLAAKPVMIYPSDPDVRNELSLLAALEGASLSRWMYSIAVAYLDSRRDYYKNWRKMAAAHRQNELNGRKGLIGVPMPVTDETR